MFSRAGWILLDGKPEFTDRRLNLPFCQQRLGQAAMATFPTGDHAIKFTKLGDSRVIVALVTICIAEIIADRGFPSRKPLSFALPRLNCRDRRNDRRRRLDGCACPKSRATHRAKWSIHRRPGPSFPAAGGCSPSESAVQDCEDRTRSADRGWLRRRHNAFREPVRQPGRALLDMRLLMLSGSPLSHASYE